MRYKTLIVIQLFILNGIFSQNIDTSIINLSRKSALKIIAFDKDNQQGYSFGTGFFVNIYNTTFILTCFHVIEKRVINIDGTTISYKPTIKGIMWNGDTLDLYPPSIKNLQDCVNYDYAILSCSKFPKNIFGLSLSSDNKNMFIGENIYFSGYPLGYPLISHTGTISGYDKDTMSIYIQSFINRGNSGGAILNSKGFVIGIITYKVLQPSINFNEYNSESSKNSKSGIYNFDKNGKPIQMTGNNFNYNLVKTLEDNLNTGIGGAINIKYARKCLYSK